MKRSAPGPASKYLYVSSYRHCAWSNPPVRANDHNPSRNMCAAAVDKLRCNHSRVCSHDCFAHCFAVTAPLADAAVVVCLLCLLCLSCLSCLLCLEEANRVPTVLWSNTTNNSSPSLSLRFPPWHVPPCTKAAVDKVPCLWGAEIERHEYMKQQYRSLRYHCVIIALNLPGAEHDEALPARVSSA